ncbi:hypothetical protein HOO54_21550 [Bacillus sp. WMMC1349]|uniref:hypothetical protein n=1 Tax=Bacillus sp. WMMC1349 TaxID=2736254 RepID=UPI001556BA7C|nr:hypothetical protein [Bacillus sp. WMMC1349]NPC94739.1 hypothetical protein [Bacillus sp. WMMC1349]
MSNKIEVLNLKSKYSREDHFTIVIDGTPLDRILDHLYPKMNFLGLIPPLADWMYIEEEKTILKERFYSNNLEEMVPVLICPDDCDLNCTVVIAEVLKQNGQVIWEKVGLNISQSVDRIGNNVEWLKKIPAFYFDQKEYFSQLDKIYSRL